MARKRAVHFTNDATLTTCNKTACKARNRTYRVSTHDANKVTCQRCIKALEKGA